MSDTDKLVKILEKSMETTFDLDVRLDRWVLSNRVKFPTWLDKTFKYPPAKNPDCAEDEKCIMKTINLYPYQRFIKDYIQYDSPYRGVLLFHAVGVGKTASSIAAAEILMNHMPVYIMTPASIRANYIGEIRKYGRRFYNTYQHWKFAHIDTFDPAKIAEVIFLSPKIMKKNKGLWYPSGKGDPNFAELPEEARMQINAQIDDIINTLFSFINYNGLRKTHIEEMVKDGNPFDNTTVVVDEIHNLISRMVNQGAIGKALYKLLFEAKNCKLIFLSGTPIINYPHEIAYLVNLLAGPKSIHVLRANKAPSKENSYRAIRELLHNNPFIDYFTIDESAHRIEYVLLPDGFQRVGRITVKRVNDESFNLKDLLNAIEKEGFKIFKKKTEQVKVLPEDPEVFGRYFIDNDSKIKNPKLFMRRILGTVSYFNAYDPVLYPTVKVSEVQLPLTKQQFKEYQDSRLTERKKELAAKKWVQNDDSTSVYRFYSRANCNFVFPESIKRPFPSKISMMAGEVDIIDNNLKIKEELTSGQIQQDYQRALIKCLEELKDSNILDDKIIGAYSPKFKAIYDALRSLNGSALMYSQFRTVEGLGIFKLFLNANGWAQCKVMKNKDGIWELEGDLDKPMYIEYNGNTEETQILKNMFNSDFGLVPKEIREIIGDRTNVRGEIIKLIMITQSGAEGISLKNVRQVHILEPYWNYIRIDQVIGRAVRTNSHIALPKEDRHVDVFIYSSVFTEEQISSSFTLKTLDKGITSDEYIYNIAKRKAGIVNGLLDLVKKASVDCALNAKRHGGVKCFAFPVDLSEDKIAVEDRIEYETLDEQYGTKTRKWNGDVLLTKKGNFIIRRETNEVYDYDFYIDSGRLIRLGILKNMNGKRQIEDTEPPSPPPAKSSTPSPPPAKSSTPSPPPAKSSTPSPPPAKTSSPAPLGLLKYNKNSCYLDSTLMALMVRKNQWIEKLLNKKDMFKPKRILPKFANDVRVELQNTYNHIHSGSNDKRVCTDLREKFSTFDDRYAKEYKIEKIEWTKTQQEPRDVINFLTRLFQIQDDVEIEFTSSTGTPRKSMVSFADLIVDATNMNSKNSIRLEDFVPVYSDPETKTTKKYLQAEVMFMNFERVLDDNTKLFTPVYPLEEIRLKTSLETSLELVSMIIHHGDDPTEGHYTLLFKENGIWYHYDDMKAGVTKIGKFQDILKNKNILQNLVSCFYINTPKI